MHPNYTPETPPIDSRSTADTRRLPGESLFLSSIDGIPLDRRTKTARRFEAILSEILSDMGGADRVSEAEFQLSRRAAGLSVQAEIVETWLAAQRFGRLHFNDRHRHAGPRQRQPHGHTRHAAAGDQRLDR